MKDQRIKCIIESKKFIVLFTFIYFFFSTGIRAQVAASFTVNVSRGCTPLQVNFTNSSTSGSGEPMNFIWQLGEGNELTTQNVSYVYNYGGTYTVRLIAINSNDPDNDRDTSNMLINVIQTPSAALNISSTYACANELIYFNFSGASKDSLRMEFGDGDFSLQNSNPITHRYKYHGNYNIKFYTYYQGCADTNESKTIVVDGPIADYFISQDSTCIGNDITFGIKSLTGVDSTRWQLGDGISSIQDTVVHSYSDWGDYNPVLMVYNSAKTCQLEDFVHIYNINAAIDYDDTTLCQGRYVYFRNLSTGNDFNTWDFGDGSTSSDENPQHAFTMGQKILSLIVENKAGCTDKIIDTLMINDVPDIQLGKDWYVCQGESVQLSASGGDRILWVPSTNLNDPTSYTPTADPPSTVSYQANVIDTATGCFNTGFIQVEVVPQPVWNIVLEPQKDTVIIGDIDTIFVQLNGNFEYTWTSDDSIVAHTAEYMVAQPNKTKDGYVDYNITVYDPRECFNESGSVQIYVREEYSFGVPDAFSPNGDGINEIIKVEGWGIKKLIEFRIFNRWGTEIFYSDNINTGWDGTIDGTPQPIDTYGYVIKIERWDNTVVDKRGLFSLVR